MNNYYENNNIYNTLYNTCNLYNSIPFSEARDAVKNLHMRAYFDSDAKLGTHVRDPYSMNIISTRSVKLMSKENSSNNEIPIWVKEYLTLEEAAKYFGIGINKIREISNEKNCEFVLWVGNKRLLNRRKMSAFLEDCFSI